MEASTLHIAPDTTERGLVFDVQRFSLHDGPGIRTTVFLKGCPLRCLWCHNPESQTYRPQLAFDAARCTHCLDCVAECTTGALQIRHGRLVVNHALCDGCGRCVDVCPQDALRIIGREQSVAEVMAEVMHDAAYYEHSGGGLTLSGGEPLAQPRFAVALLQAAKAQGLHTCLDTSGAIGQDRLAQVLPFVDLFLYDYKGTDPALHRQQTGVTNDLILKNLDYLYRQDARLILRCPLVPGVNDTREHLQGIAALSARYPRLEGVEIIAYHNMGKAKAEQIGYENPLLDLPTASEEVKVEWLETLHELGCARAALG